MVDYGLIATILKCRPAEQHDNSFTRGGHTLEDGTDDLAFTQVGTQLINAILLTSKVGEP